MAFFKKKKKPAFEPGRLSAIMCGRAMPTAKELKQLKKLYKSLDEEYNSIPTTPMSDEEVERFVNSKDGKNTPTTPMDDVGMARFSNPFETKPD